MISVGINENIIIDDVTLSKENWLNITFRQIGGKEFNAFEALGAENDAEREEINTIDIKIFNIKVPKDADKAGNKRTREQITKLVISDISRNKAVLLHLVRGYLTKDQIKFDLYNGTGLDANNFEERLVDQPVLDIIHRNMCNDFMAMVRPFMKNEALLFRLLLVRTSKEKHFATFRTSYIDENPFWESMSIPKKDSKMAFTKSEIAQGLNDGTPAAKTEADKPAEQAPLAPVNIFGAI